MGISYALVARHTAVLAEYSAEAGNANSVARRILENLPAPGPDEVGGETRMSYSQDDYLFHVAVSHGVTFICMADEAFGRRAPHAFLNDIRTSFTAAYGEDEVRDAPAYEFNAEFSRVLNRTMMHYSTGVDVDAIARVKGEISEVKIVMMENIEKVLDRGEKIELLVDKTENLRFQADNFHRTGRALRRRMWWQNLKMKLMLASAVLTVIFVLFCIFCFQGGKNCTKKSD
uniref:V-SNARE coiled-coil homology domain-containing protein n=1 Tax=Mantoniella antarctica TaxID=81844 RepID=A0A7S0SQ61_9CHLO|mmetsp:Transcript_305/g.786  ORF Transcript_305/g.786 Transcript_305/m.786 type:complete len:230 (+) Transcript_305:76-765(+)